MDPAAPATEAKRRRPAARWAPVAVAIALGTLVLINAAPWLTACFGESHEGRNAAVWSRHRERCEKTAWSRAASVV